MKCAFCPSERSLVILSVAKNLHSKGSADGGEILRCAQDDKCSRCVLRTLRITTGRLSRAILHSRGRLCHMRHTRMLFPGGRLLAVQPQREALRAAARFDKFAQRGFVDGESQGMKLTVQVGTARIGDHGLPHDHGIAGKLAGLPPPQRRSTGRSIARAPCGRNRQRHRDNRSPRPGPAGRSTYRGGSNAGGPVPAGSRGNPARPPIS